MTATTFDDPLDELREWLREQWDSAMNGVLYGESEIERVLDAGKADAYQRTLDRIT